MLKHFRLFAPALFLAGCSMMPGSAGAPAAAMHAEHTSTNLILVYSLKDGVTPADFENWVRTTDYPSMRGIKRVADFRTHRVERSLMGPEKPAIQYIETFSIPDLDGFTKEDMGGETVQKVMGSFMGFAAAPQFLVVTEIK